MTVYRRLTETELLALPPGQQREARAFRDYLDAVSRGASKDELRLLGARLELALLDVESEELVDDIPRQALKTG
jgi:hypothetical protein